LQWSLCRQVLVFSSSYMNYINTQFLIILCAKVNKKIKLNSKIRKKIIFLWKKVVFIKLFREICI